jgi:hypothetical protein
LGFTDQNDFPNVGASLWDRMHREDFDRINEDYERFISDPTGKTGYDVEYRIAKKTGEYIHAHEAASILRNEEGVPLFVIGTWKDITEEVLQRDTELSHKTAYNKSEVEKLAANIAKLAEDDLHADFSVAPPNQFTQEEYDNFNVIISNLEKVRKALLNKGGKK